MPSISSLLLPALALAVAIAGQPAFAQEIKRGIAKPRVVVMTDVSPWETDDSESLVRLLVHADLLEIEGLIFTTGWSLSHAPDDLMGLIHVAIDAYAHDLPNLCKRSNQHEHPSDESHQSIGYWPTAQYLRDRTMIGSRNRGIEHLGEGNDSDGSRFLLGLADEDDDRPLWVALWGGGNTLAQAIWRVRRERSPEEVKKFLSKLRVYSITDQDREQKTPFSNSSHQWMRQQFESELLFIWDECAWKYQNGNGKKNWSDYELHIQNHGQLGRAYPKFKFGVEGDTPSFLYLLPNGLSDPEDPTQGGWGGSFEWGLAEDRQTRCYTNWDGSPKAQCNRIVERFHQATFNNFAARMDWAEKGTGNRNPVLIVDGQESLSVEVRTVEAGSELTLDASASWDPDGDELVFAWYILPHADAYRHDLRIDGQNRKVATLSIPNDLADASIHLICELSDNGTHALSSYRRFILKANRKASR